MGVWRPLARITRPRLILIDDCTDVTANSSLSRLQLHLPDEADVIRRDRYRFIESAARPLIYRLLELFSQLTNGRSIWRPLSGPEQDCPLAMCDYRTICGSDLVEADVVFPHYCDEAYEILHNNAHRWFYQQAMTSDEVVMFKLYDSSNTEAKCRGSELPYARILFFMSADSI